MTTQETVQALRKEAVASPLFNAICLIFATRERARNQVTVKALQGSLKKGGWPGVSVEECVKALRFLASLNVGKLRMNAKDEVAALVDIKVKLQDVGSVAVAKTETLGKFKPHKKYAQLVAATPAPEVSQISDNKVPVSVHVTISGKDVMFPVEVAMTADRLGKLLTSLHASLKSMEA